MLDFQQQFISALSCSLRFPNRRLSSATVNAEWPLLKLFGMSCVQSMAFPSQVRMNALPWNPGKLLSVSVGSAELDGSVAWFCTRPLPVFLSLIVSENHWEEHSSLVQHPVFLTDQAGAYGQPIYKTRGLYSFRQAYDFKDAQDMPPLNLCAAYSRPY